MSHSPTYSLVIPIYNEAENIIELHQQLTQVLRTLETDTEIIFVDDGSHDSSLKLLRSIQEVDPRCRYLSLARNFGHQIAVTAGLHHAKGKAIIIMDADLQDPPTLIPQLIEKWKQGYQVVYAQRISRQDSYLKRTLAFWFYRVLQQLSNVDIPADTGDFCLMDREIVHLLNQMPERNRYIRGLRSWVGYRQTAVKFERPARFAGTAKYTFRKSLRLAISSLLAFSTVPLTLSTYLGLTTALIATLMMGLTFYWRVFEQSDRLIGFTMITIAIFFLGAVQLICLGILGAYIGRIYEEVQGRPLYTIKEINGFPQFPQIHGEKISP